MRREQIHLVYINKFISTVKEIVKLGQLKSSKHNLFIGIMI